MAKTRSERKKDTAEFFAKHWTYLQECLAQSKNNPTETWNLFCRTYYNPSKFQRDQVYRQRILLLKKEYKDTIQKAYEEARKEVVNKNGNMENQSDK